MSTESLTIWELPVTGGNPHLLFPGNKDLPKQCCGDWSPDGEYYYFRVDHLDNQAIWVLPEHHSIFHRGANEPVPLTHGPLRFSAPVPDASGKRLFVVGEDVRVELVQYDKKAKRFDTLLPGLSAGPVEFSSDGKWIAYISYPEMMLWRSRADGTEKLQLTSPPSRASLPRWSPDGARIVYTDVSFAHPSRLSVISASGGVSELVSQSADDDADADPNWYPDGNALVFSRSSVKDDHHLGIFQLDLKSRTVTHIPDSSGLYSPRVSPDGRTIAAFKDDQDTLVLFDTNKKKWRTIPGGGHYSYPEWSHDGKYVYLQESRDGVTDFARVRISDGTVEQILSLKDFPRRLDIFAIWIGLTPDDAPILMRDRSAQEIYALNLSFH